MLEDKQIVICIGRDPRRQSPKQTRNMGDTVIMSPIRFWLIMRMPRRS